MIALLTCFGVESVLASWMVPTWSSLEEFPTLLASRYFECEFHDETVSNFMICSCCYCLAFMSVKVLDNHYFCSVNDNMLTVLCFHFVMFWKNIFSENMQSLSDGSADEILLCMSFCILEMRG